MKKVLITGANSYVGLHVEEWLMNEPDKYYVETLDMKDPNWKDFDFSKFDVVFHVAGIAHIKQTKKNESLYYKVNRDLAFEVAKKAKKNEIKQFIFMSSMSVYGMVKGEINQTTLPNPVDAYGKSKLEAENLITELETNEFKICIVRPPMIYGFNSPGNFLKLQKISKYFLFFPDFKNIRSMIYIDNLAIIVKHLIKTKISGIVFPDNIEYVNTFELVKLLRSQRDKKTYKMKLIKLFIRFSMVFSKTSTKIFGSLYYEKSLKYKLSELLDFNQTIIEIYNKNND